MIDSTHTHSHDGVPCDGHHDHGDGGVADGDDPIMPASALLAKQKEAKAAARLNNGNNNDDDDDDESIGSDLETEVEAPPAKLDGDLFDDGSLIKEITRAGTGEELPRDGYKVSVHYTGTLASDGSKFDSSRDRNEPFVVTLDKKTSSSVIRGWDEGIRTMRKGEIAKFTIASHKAYGERGSPPKIPGGATLVFEIECLDFSNWEDVSEKKDGSVRKSVITKAKGSEYRKPNDCSRCTISIDGGADIEFVLDEPNEAITPGVETAVRTMKKGEVAKFQIGETQTTIALKSFENEKESWDMSTAERIEAATKKRLAGNAFFEKADWPRAKRRYDAAVSLIQYDTSFSDDEKKAARGVRLPCHLNLSAVALKQRLWGVAIEQAGKALEIESANVKALFRRAQARLANEEFDEAALDLAKALTAEPTNVAVLKEQTRLKQLQKERDARDKALYTKMLFGGK